MPLIHIEPLPPRASKSDILAFLDQAGGLARRRVGRIELHGNRAAVEVPEGWPSRLVKLLDGRTMNDRRVRVWAAGQPADSPSSEDHFQRSARCLDLESRAEAEEALRQARRLSAQTRSGRETRWSNC